MVTKTAAGNVGEKRLARKSSASTPPADVPMARTSRLVMSFSPAGPLPGDKRSAREAGSPSAGIQSHRPCRECRFDYISRPGLQLPASLSAALSGDDKSHAATLFFAGREE